jgi:hypothetical protein
MTTALRRFADNCYRCCGHKAIPHGDHVDYLVGGHLHYPHRDHCDHHGTVEVVSHA